MAGAFDAMAASCHARYAPIPALAVLLLSTTATVIPVSGSAYMPVMYPGAEPCWPTSEPASIAPPVAAYQVGALADAGSGFAHRSGCPSRCRASDASACAYRPRSVMVEVAPAFVKPMLADEVVMSIGSAQFNAPSSPGSV